MRRPVLATWTAAALLTAALPAAANADEHDAVVLRISTSGGIAAELTSLLEVPAFTLHADGTIIVRGSKVSAAGEGDPITTLSTATVDPAMREALLADAAAVLRPWLGRAPSGGPADATITILSIDAGDTTGAAFIPAFGSDDAHSPLVDLVESLADPGIWETAAATPVPFEPTAYLASFVEEDPELPGATPWPWEDDIPSASLIPAVDGGLIPTVTLTPEQVAPVAELPAGPRSDIVLVTPDGRGLRMFLRPLLPDELAGPAGVSG